MKYLEHTEATYFESKDVSVATNNRKSHSPLEYTVAYYNHLNVDLNITNRNGVPFKIPPSGSRKNCVTVRFTYRIDGTVKIDPKNIFHQFGADTAEGKTLLNAIGNSENNGNLGKKTFTLDYVYSRDDIVKNGGVLYVTDLDVMLSVTNNAEDTVHPYSSAADRYKLIESETNVNDTDKFGYSIYIISNDGRVSDKFVNIGGSVFRVPSSKNQSLRDGVYLCSSGILQNNTKDPMPTVLRYEFDVAFEELFLYDDPETAAKLGDRLAARDHELKELQLEFKEVEHRLKVDRTTYEHKLNDKKQELENLRLEQEQRFAKQDHERRIRGLQEKEYYESRSATRKDSSEIVKYIPTILAGTIAIGLAIVKFK